METQITSWSSKDVREKGKRKCSASSYLTLNWTCNHRKVEKSVGRLTEEWENDLKRKWEAIVICHVKLAWVTLPLFIYLFIYLSICFWKCERATDLSTVPKTGISDRYIKLLKAFIIKFPHTEVILSTLLKNGLCSVAALILSAD